MRVYDKYGDVRGTVPLVQGSQGLESFRQVGPITSIECWYCAGQIASSAVGTGVPAVDTLIATPIAFPDGGTVDRIAFRVTTLAIGAARIGIYQATSKTNLYPSALLVDGGAVDVSTTGVKAATVSVSVAPGVLYWLTYLCGTLPPTIRCIGVNNCYPIFGYAADIGSAPGVGLTVAQAYGALPSTFPAGAVQLTAVPIPSIFARLS